MTVQRADRRTKGVTGLSMFLSLAPATEVHSIARETHTDLIETYVDR